MTMMQLFYGLLADQHCAYKLYFEKKKKNQTETGVQGRGDRSVTGIPLIFVYRALFYLFTIWDLLF